MEYFTKRKVRRASVEQLQNLRLGGFIPETSYVGCDASITVYRKVIEASEDKKGYDFLFSLEEIYPEDFYADTTPALWGRDTPICKATAGDYWMFKSCRYLRLIKTTHERIQAMIDGNKPQKQGDGKEEG